MATRKDTLWEQFLAPVFKLFIDPQEIHRVHERIDWPTVTAQIARPDLTYPDYYRTGNFHGIEGGYLTTDAALSYDPVTRYVLPPGEEMVRNCLIQAVRSKPRRILDLGCGTGSSTLLLKKAFPQAEVIGLDLSPYMLAVAQLKAQQENLGITFRHGDAEATGLPNASFDLVTASLLFHETPPEVTECILREMFRLVTVGGECLILDGNQNTLRNTEWLNNVFEEPHINAYAAGNLNAWMQAAGFGAVQTQEHWWLHQVTRGVKPLAAPEPKVRTAKFETLSDLDGDLGFAGAGA
ncbi:class I SAM-dependent methyltransferase [Leptolyngbya sp. FACHB-261]|uniref:class I SAM-dependent methyltransferase n=1 Tax=Leptolyngbya sp. FACHB-261 TaxID=2692806 RepID=UPI001684B8EA|nr:class I SAM-dependent methyltransferase [Leptolyngbya sp. FACHB-261]MBD2101801.1 methyltransferase domain-containing protein [Leptolyngbya sp. FACHB-261]